MIQQIPKLSMIISHVINSVYSITLVPHPSTILGGGLTSVTDNIRMGRGYTAYFQKLWLGLLLLLINRFDGQLNEVFRI